MKIMFNIDKYFSLSASLSLTLEKNPKKFDSKKQSAMTPLQCMKDLATSK